MVRWISDGGGVDPSFCQQLMVNGIGRTRVQLTTRIGSKGIQFQMTRGTALKCLKITELGKQQTAQS